MGNRDSLPVTRPKEGANSQDYYQRDDTAAGSLKMSSVGNSKDTSPSAMSNAPAESDSLKGEEGGCIKRTDGLKIIIISTIVFAIAITVALIIQIYVGQPQVPPHGAVTSSVQECSEIGVDILKKGGTAVDAAVATMFCVGVYNPHKSGLGGGGFMLIFKKKNNIKEIIDFRESSPASVPENVELNTLQGPKSIAVPGELSGMTKAHESFGKMPWSDLIKPTIDAIKKGIRVTKSLADALTKLNNTGTGFPQFKNGNSYVKINDTIKNDKMAELLTELQNDPLLKFYQGGTISQEILKAASGGNLQSHDLASYNVTVQAPITTTFKDYEIITTTAPSSGPIILLILNILENYVKNLTSNPFVGNSTDEWYHVMVEALKIGYSQRIFLGDPAKDISVHQTVDRMINKSFAEMWYEKINPDKPLLPEMYINYQVVPPMQHGTEQISVIDNDELFVSVSTSLNNDFGSGIVTERGIILNSHMTDFSNEAHNKPSPGKRPFSSMAPTVVLHSKRICGKRLAMGGINGTPSLSGVVQLILNLTQTKDANTNITEMINYPRIFAVAQPSPDVFIEESKLAEDIIADLKSRGHNVQTVKNGEINSVNLAMKINENFFAIGDPRSADMGATY